MKNVNNILGNIDVYSTTGNIYTITPLIPDDDTRESDIEFAILEFADIHDFDIAFYENNTEYSTDAEPDDTYDQRALDSFAKRFNY